MKLFQQLLVAPAALGLFAPISAVATEINLDTVSSYSPVTNTFQASTQLTDIHPNDWTYQALSEIRNIRRCNASLPTGVMTRTEAAALLNKCIGEASTLSDTELRLVDEFSSELATLRGTSEVVDSFAFEASAFSTTTVLTGSSNINIGSESKSADDELKGNYALGYSLTTSFTGKDALIADFELGNAGATGLGIDSESSNGNSPVLEDLYYSFPWNGFDICIGAKMDGDACLAGTYSKYSEPVVNGSNDAWSESVGNGTALAISKVFDSGLNVSGNIQGGNTGLLSSGDDFFTGQIGYDTESYGGAISYTSNDGEEYYYGIGLYISAEGWPTVSFGYDITDPATASDTNLANVFVGAEGEVGDGTLGASVQVEESGNNGDVTTSSYEMWYAYPVNDSITLTPSIWFKEDGNGTQDTTGYALTVGFSF
tara:strand:+ start:554 stop:1837 length:1284 start_codon:yes stop_codon:yes gene_type:complete